MKFIRKLFVFLIILLTLACSFLFLIGYGYYSNTLHEKSLTGRVEEVTKKEHYTSFENLPKNYINAVVATEDRRYYSHGPVDFIGIARAFYTNIRDKDFDEGGSTITQQVAKNLYFIESENVVRRKVAEFFMAVELENKYSKEEILEMYINTIYFGDGYYGIKQACNGYLNKEPKDMTLAEATMMAGIPNAPSAYSPTVNKKLCKERQNKVISSMKENGYITEDEASKIDQSFIDNIEYKK